MNFEFMPELGWRFGYPAAIILMIIAGLTPYLYFKRKNWLSIYQINKDNLSKVERPA